MLAQPSNLNNPVHAPEKDPVDRSIAIGLACTLLFHILLVWLSPNFAFEKFSGVHSGISVTHNNRGKTFDIELAQPKVPEKEKAPFKFVETNPDAPENIPDKTTNFSNRNQQSAQPDPAKELDPENRPSVKGQDKIKNDTAIVAGEMSKPQDGSQPTLDSTKTDAVDQQEQKARMELVPLEGTQKIEGKSPDGLAMNISKSKSPTNNSEKSLEGAHDATDPTGGLLSVPSMTHAAPKARPRLTAPMPSILTNRASGSRNAGIIGQDARWSEFGEYLNELEAIVVAQWYRTIEESRVSPPHGSHVTVTFKINSKGETDIVKVEDADAGKQGVWSCSNAITYPQPYRKWSESMIAVLGDDQTLVFSFYYL